VSTFTSDAKELMMPKAEYEVFEALNPFFEVVMGAYTDSLMVTIISTRLPKTHSSSSDITFPVGL